MLEYHKIKSMPLIKDILKYIISFLFLSILLIPIYEVYVPYENKTENECWEFRYIWEDFSILLSYTILVLGWFLFLYKKNKYLKTSLIVFSIINLIGIFFATSMPAQDLVFWFGAAVFMLLCFLILFYLIKFEKINNSQ